MRSFRDRAVQSKKPWRRGSLVRRELVVSQGVDATALQCRNLLESFGEPRASDPPSDDVIEAVTPPSIKSMGTVLRAHLAPTAEGTRVTILAWPGAALFDWGESTRLVDRISRQVEEWSRTPPLPR
jgi:hypothetical protein